MDLTMQIIVGVFGVTFAALGVRSMFMPKNMAESRGLSPTGIAGLTEIRGVFGGFFLACATMLVLGLATGETLWFLAVAILMGAVVIGRLVGIVADGFAKVVLPNLVAEIVIGGGLVTAHFVLG